MIPSVVQKFLQSHREEQGCFCLQIDPQLNVIDMFGNFKKLGISSINPGSSILDLFPFLITETFDSNFEIPFFNINEDHVCNIYFLKSDDADYVILVDKSEIFQITQKYQQFAHEDNISKNKFKRLAEELERAKHKLNESNQQKATLIAMLSHELGTPLTSIMGYSELLKNGDIETEKAANIIYRNATDLMLMIENTLLFGQTEASGHELNQSECEVLEFFSELAATVTPILQDCHLNLSIINTEPQTVYMDRARVRQILLNLLSNAIKYTHSGSVSMEYQKQDGQHIFAVKDTGVGIPKGMQKIIFDPWQRLNDKETKGAGIGLIISQSIAKTMQGEVRLQSSTPGVGSTFELTLPLVEPKASWNDTVIKDHSIAHNKSIVIIDDDFDVLELLEVMLEPLNPKLHMFQKLNRAKPFLEKNTVDMVITDYHIGHVRATDVVEYLNYIGQKVPVLLLTALPSMSLRNSYKSSGFEDVITKPIQQEKLIKTILKHLKHD